MITTAEFLRIIAIILAFPAAFFFLRAISRARKSRTATYYATRREAAHASNRDLSRFLATTVIATVLGVLSFIWPSDIPVRAPEPPAPTVAITLTPGSMPKVYIVPTSTPVVATVAPTAPPTPTPVTTPIQLITTAEPAATEISGRHLKLSAISSAISSSGQPISPTTEFSKGVSSIYVFYQYRDAIQGTLIRETWLRDGGSVYFDSSTWSHPGSGSTYIWWSPKNGFDPGLYEVRVVLGDIKQFSANFVVR
ncbi:MAG: hypothetical protein M1434_06275 [Chloroflexi bacterium]|nr:hypothetical protein [Chloroflexota bacterium]MCL5274341.1 hypothetical protein [Chloroflexota bacterium]